MNKENASKLCNKLEDFRDKSILIKLRLCFVYIFTNLVSFLHRTNQVF